MPSDTMPKQGTALTVSGKVPPILTSLWDGLSEHLIARFWEVRRVGTSSNWAPAEGGPMVLAPLTDADLEQVIGWQSPFEGSGATPTLQAMMQSGALNPMLNAVGATGDNQFAAFSKSVEGRAGVTKLNSTQVFNAMQPLKINVTALFRAWRDSASEVEEPVNQLMRWALPTELCDDGPMLARLAGAAKDVVDGQRVSDAALKALLPSTAPVKIAMRYKNRVYSPMVIESIGLPLDSPVDSGGRFVNMKVSMTLCSLAAIDRNDWDDSGGSRGYAYRGFRV